MFHWSSSLAPVLFDEELGREMGFFSSLFGAAFWLEPKKSKSPSNPCAGPLPSVTYQPFFMLQLVMIQSFPGISLFSGVV
jgi:hypothetical protein